MSNRTYGRIKQNYDTLPLIWIMDFCLVGFHINLCTSLVTFVTWVALNMDWGWCPPSVSRRTTHVTSSPPRGTRGSPTIQMTMHTPHCGVTAVWYCSRCGAVWPPYVTGGIHHAPIRPLDALLPHYFSQNSSSSSFSPKFQTTETNSSSKESRF